MHQQPAHTNVVCSIETWAFSSNILYTEVMQGATPIIIDNLRKFICVSHFECMITVAHNTFYNSHVVFLRFKYETASLL